MANITAEELKKKVLTHLDKNDNTFCSITFQLLDTGMEQHQVQYLLNELEHDQLNILGYANDRLNTNKHVLSTASRIEARITPQGKDYVKTHFNHSILDYLEKHSIIRIVVLIGGIAGGIAIMIAIIAKLV
jgi:hypothetical protein